jgi:hypothetical protein
MKNLRQSTMKPKQPLRQGKGLIRGEAITSMIKIIRRSTIGSIEEPMRRWMNTIGTCSENSSQG